MTNLKNINDTEHIRKLIEDAHNPVHSVMSPEIPQAAIDGMEKAKNADLEEFFKGMKKSVSPAPQSLLDNVSYPRAFSLVQYDLPAESQGNVGSCTSWGNTNCIENKYSQLTGKKLNFADTYLWFRQGEVPNSWTSATTATKYWTVKAEYWDPYAKDGKPGWLEQKVCAPKNPRQLNNLEEMYEEISKGNPVVFSFSANFNNFAPNGIVNAQKATVNGAHAVCAVAYNRDTKTFTCKNSWGNYGDKGYLHFPEQYVLEGNFWINMIAFDQDLLIKDSVKPNPSPVPPKPVNNHDVRCEVTVISKSPRQGGGFDHVYDWKITGPDVGTVSKTEEFFFKDYGFPRPTKPVKAVDMAAEAKSYIGSYAANWSPGKIKVTFSDGFLKEVEIKFP